MDCAGPGVVTASCSSGTWSVTATPCATVFCGGSQCGPGTLCVERVSGAYLAECDLNPCGPGPITCDCAASLCAGAECSTSGTTVTCNSCPSGLCP
jgi:hypothetical protein